jgi:hypothetical protein
MSSHEQRATLLFIIMLLVSLYVYGNLLVAMDAIAIVARPLSTEGEQLLTSTYCRNKLNSHLLYF